MFKDGDDEDEHNMNVTRYPCMPSLVALQQMRNRLQMAHLGKKLMKWTALATGRELRRLAIEINETHRRFNEDMRTAFMLLARGRYFCSNLNQYVLENVEAKACVRVETTNKSISGVKVPHMEVVELGGPPYNHLGLEKGGHTIEEAKEKWRELLKKMILMVQQRTGFARIEVAHKNATKRKNALMKIVIPKIIASVKYILDELEEQAREEFYRFKKILEVKRKHAKKKAEALEAESDIPKLAIESIEEVEAEEKGEEDDKNEICDDLPEKEDIKAANPEVELKVSELRAHIKSVIDVGKYIEEKGTLSIDMKQFLKTAEQVLDEKKNNESFNEETGESIQEVSINYEKKVSDKSINDRNRLNVTSRRTSTTEALGIDKQTQTDMDVDGYVSNLKEITRILRKTTEDGTTLKIRKEVSSSTNPINVPINNGPVLASKSESFICNSRCDDNQSLQTFQEIVCSRIQSEVIPLSSNTEKVVKSSSLTSFGSDIENNGFDDENDLEEIRKDFKELLDLAGPLFRRHGEASETNDDNLELTESEWKLIASIFENKSNTKTLDNADDSQNNEK